MDRLDAPALIDCHVYDHRTWLHRFQVFPPNESWSDGARNEYRSHHQICGGDLLQDVMTIGVDECDVGWHYVREVAQAFEAQVEHSDLCAQPGRHFRRIDSDDAATKDHHLPRRHSRHTAEQYAAAAVELLQVFGAFLHGHAAGYL